MSAVLPKQVQAQLDEAERVVAALSQPTDMDPAPAANVEVVDPPPADPTPPPTEPAPAAAAPVEPKNEAYWEHRFNTLEGIHRKTAEQLKTQGEQARQLAAQLESMRQQPPAQVVPEQPLITDKDASTFGADLVDMARRAAQEVTRDLVKRLGTLEGFVRSLEPQVKRVKQVEDQVNQTREDRFLSELTVAVPDWEAVNADPRWLQWLREYDPVAGSPRQVSLDQAQQALDFRRVTALFKLFKATITPPAAPTPTVPKPSLARQVAPARTSTVTVPPGQPKVYSAQDYTYWLEPKRVHDTDTATLTAMLAEMDKAFGEGRIQW